MAVTKCANCGAVVNSEAEGCPECGADPRTGEGAVAGFAVVENCAGCGASVDAGTERCANCGADPRTGLTAAQAAEVNHAAAMMGWGAVLAVGGLLLTLITYARVSQGGGTYFVAYGPMIAGVILFFMGLSKSSKTKSKTVITPKAVSDPQAVITCAGCGTTVSAAAKECPGCGADPRTGGGEAKPGDSPQLDSG